MMEDLLQYTALELGKRIQSRQITAVDACEASLAQIQKREPKLNSFITVDVQSVRQRAKQVQKQIEAGSLCGPLAGVPMAIKDNISTKGMPTTCGSRMLEHYIPTYDATVVQKLEQAGAILLGKTNMDEFAMGNTNETSYFGPVKHPVDERYAPGGSSGGSGAAVAAKECFFALGSDTGGSVRQPAAHCGVVGLKPTYGTVSRYGLVAYGSSLEQIGPLCRDVADCAAVMEIISGADERDSTCVPSKAQEYTKALTEDISGIRIGMPTECFGSGLQKEIREALYQAAKWYRQKGALVETFSLGLSGEEVIAAYYVIACAEASSNLERFDGVKYGYRAQTEKNLHEMYKMTRSQAFGSEVKRRIMLGNYVLSSGYYEAYYLKALQAKRLIQRAYQKAFAHYDILLLPTTPATAQKLGTPVKSPLEQYLQDMYTVAANLTGMPAISLPCGKTPNGFPIGMQLMGDMFQEKTLFAAAYAYQQDMKKRGGWLCE